MVTRKIRTVSVNERGQIVIPEDMRKDFGISKETTLVLIEGEGEIVIRKELDVLKSLESENKFWKVLSKEALKNSWTKEDKVWDKIYEESR